MRYKFKHGYCFNIVDINLSILNVYLRIGKCLKFFTENPSVMTV